MTLRDAQGRLLRGLVLAAHGSRRGHDANALVRRIAESLRARRLFDEVAVAFHQGEPGFDSVLDELASEETTVVPFFTSEGHYTRVILPEALARNRCFGELRLRQTPPVGTHAGIGALVARRVSGLMREHRIERASTTLALVGHGTRRHPESRSSTLQLADALRQRRVAGEVIAAFLDDDPPLERLMAAAALPHVIVVPFLIGGAHVSEDIPRLLGQGDSQLATGDCRLILDHAIGTYPGLTEIIIDLARRHTPPAAPRFRPRLISAGASPPNARRKPAKVYLVGGGPGDPGLITVRGLDLLRQADVVVHDRLIGSELLVEARPGAQLIDVGKGPGHAPYPQAAINDLLVEHAQSGRTVVRLKGGDPFVFGRGSEEVEACRVAGLEVHVVAGVSSALAAPAAAGIPVTARGVAQSFTVMTGHVAHDASTSASAASLSSASLPSADTLVIMMGRSNLAQLAEELIAGGRDPSTPAACIQSATTPQQRVARGTLATIAEAADREGLESPVVTVIGAVAALGGKSAKPAGALTLARHPERSEGSGRLTLARGSLPDVPLDDPSLRSG